MATPESEINIPADYHSGNKCIENGIPWFVPQSIYKLNSLLSNYDNVLEIGSGGSTLFFSKRCHHIFSIETNYNWYSVVLKELKKQNITNITYVLCEDETHIISIINKLDISFTVASIDSIHGYNRSKFLSNAARSNPHLRTIVLDNFSDTSLFPDHGFMPPNQICKEFEDPDGPEWYCEDFLDNWVGSGTRIVFKQKDNNK